MIKALIVDDDEDLLEMVSMMLRASDMEVWGLISGDGLMEAIEKHAPQIILMDIYMGDQDGRKLCREIKNNELYRHLPVILYSAGNITPVSIADSGADLFLHKPFDMKTLVNKVKQMAGVKEL
ncbi:MAG: response regulator [Agriterribacter sp.]